MEVAWEVARRDSQTGTAANMYMYCAQSCALAFMMQLYLVTVEKKRNNKNIYSFHKAEQLSKNRQHIKSKCIHHN